ncbi:SGNH/GDSL hydrolase family protein [Robbsia sp. Bb-Pol-6]|uniref:SGNH/GDSL hydrolase family protein n=1 Tax=Robbsia betulipollinis TaxID=2981849 RepID=A0ABT3ZTA6_9BURK|nr:SGNH/GDSL hydrolase family protein [Robbsia betulipollinis]MCY0389794.1 SGNH/GDSL hydrolase family protein [Robbsia betulipollinis]
MKNLLFYAALTLISSAATASPLAPVYAWGDSLTYGVNATDTAHSWPALLAQKTGRPVTNLGYPGQTSTGIAERFGAIPLRIVRGGEIPSSGATEIQLADVEVFDGYSPLPFPVSLAGVRGDIRERPMQEFTRASSGSPVKFAAGSALVIPAPYSPGSIAVIWACRNDVVRDWNTKICLDNISAIVDKARARNQNFLILSVLTSNEEKPSDSRYEKVVEINDNLKKLYPGNYLDVEDILMKKIPGKIGTISPNFRIRNGHDDGIHLNDSGYEVVANSVAELIAMRHW